MATLVQRDERATPERDAAELTHYVGGRRVAGTR